MPFHHLLCRLVNSPSAYVELAVQELSAHESSSAVPGHRLTVAFHARVEKFSQDSRVLRLLLAVASYFQKLLCASGDCVRATDFERALLCVKNTDIDAELSCEQC